MAERKSDDAIQGELVNVDYTSGKPTPAWVKEVIDAHLAIEAEDAASAGAVGFMARALVIATMPYKDPKREVYTRVNGDFKLRIVAGSEQGIPYGAYPRLLMSWVATEAVRTQSPNIELGESLSHFLRDVMNVRVSGGSRGTATRVANQMQRLFGSMITATYDGAKEKKGFRLKNVTIAEELELDNGGLWLPPEGEAIKWRSNVLLTNAFFKELITAPVPIDLRAYSSLRNAPLAMDIYSWLTYRMSYTQRRSKPIPWELLMNQFGSGYSTDQAARDFKKNFLKALKMVSVVYPSANLEIKEQGLVLLPSAPHIPKIWTPSSGGGQNTLF